MLVPHGKRCQLSVLVNGVVVIGQASSSEIDDIGTDHKQTSQLTRASFNPTRICVYKGVSDASLELYRAPLKKHRSLSKQARSRQFHKLGPRSYNSAT